MLNNYFTIREVAAYLDNDFRGYVLKQIYTQEKNKLLIEMVRLNEDESEDNRKLEYSIAKGFNYLLEKFNFSKAKINYTNIFAEIYGQKISKIDLFNNDRAISIILESGLEIIFTFFPNNSNCFLIDKSIIINAFKDKKENSQKTILEIIPSKKILSTDATEDISASKYIRQNYRIYGNVYENEVICRTGIAGEELINTDKKRIIDKEFQAIENQLSKPEYLLYFVKNESIPSLIRLKQFKEYELKEFENINILLIEYLRLKYRHEKVESIKGSRMNELNGMLKNIEKKIKGLEIQTSYSEDVDNFKRQAEIILQNLHIINKGDKKYIHVSEKGEELIINLKENLGPAENAQYYFEKYKKQKSSVGLLSSKIINMEKEKSRIETEINKVNEMREYKTLLKEEKKSMDIKDEATSKFRKFRLTEKFEVWVGKDSASNDLLTTQYTSPNDLWFHVRGASGSHTVLKINNKKESIGKEIISIAAAIAAYYSKARNARSVPVAYTEKKFVKKKKGFREGTVVMEREKVVFVTPSLPYET